MPRFALKRREPLVKFVRRAALGHLEAADAALRAGADGGKRAPARVARARRELLRLRALLRLMRGPLGPSVFSREHGAVQRLVRRVAPHARETQTAARLKRAGVRGAAKAPNDERKRRPPAAGPALLRALADLAEIRVRAAHWHVPEAGFDALAPALRSAWRQSARPLTGGRAATPAALADAALTLHDQLRCVEQVWPAAIDAPRRLSRGLAADAAQLTDLDALLAQPPEDRGPAGTLRQPLSATREKTNAAVNDAAARLRAETPAAFTRRVGAYWAVWRRPPR